MAVLLLLRTKMALLQLPTMKMALQLLPRTKMAFLLLPKMKMALQLLPRTKMALLLPPKIKTNGLSKMCVLSVFIFYKHSIFK